MKSSVFCLEIAEEAENSTWHRCHLAQESAFRRHSLFLFVVLMPSQDAFGDPRVPCTQAFENAISAREEKGWRRVSCLPTSGRCQDLGDGQIMAGIRRVSECR